mgnify:CR=1 FL=1
MKGKKIQMDAPVVLLVFSLFAACVLMVLLTGADAYQRLVERDQTAFDRRSCTQYLATKVRQGDGQGQIWVDTFAEDEGPQCLYQEEDGYLTRIYCYDGWLRELYAQPDAGSGAPGRRAGAAGSGPGSSLWRTACSPLR